MFRCSRLLGPSFVAWTALTLVGCAAPSEDAAGPAEPLFVYISPDPLGVNDFLIMGRTGLEAAAARHGARTLVLESDDPTSRAENVRAAVDDGAEMVVVLGFEFDDIVPRAARDAPDVDFLVVDQCVPDPPANVSCATFREHEGAFLLGATAAALTDSGKIGVLGTVDIPFLRRYTEGFTRGARHVDPDVLVEVRWVGGENPFADPVRAKEQALALGAEGVDIVFAAAAGGNYGVFEAAAERGFHVFGLDVDQCPAASGRAIDNLIKRVDTAIVEAVDRIRDGERGLRRAYGLADDGVGTVASLGEPASSVCAIRDHPDVIAMVRQLRDEIAAGTITIDDPMRAAP